MATKSKERPRAGRSANGATAKANDYAERLWKGEWSAVVPAVLDPATSERDASDEEVFSTKQHPLGTVEMWCWRGVRACGDIASDKREGQVELTVARNVANCSDMFLEIEADGMAVEWGSSQEPLSLQLRVTPAALVTLSVVLPRVVEAARRHGLLDERG